MAATIIVSLGRFSFQTFVYDELARRLHCQNNSFTHRLSSVTVEKWKWYTRSGNRVHTPYIRAHADDQYTHSNSEVCPWKKSTCLFFVTTFNFPNASLSDYKEELPVVKRFIVPLARRPTCQNVLYQAASVYHTFRRRVTLYNIVGSQVHFPPSGHIGPIRTKLNCIGSWLIDERIQLSTSLLFYDL